LGLEVPFVQCRLVQVGVVESSEPIMGGELAKVRIEVDSGRMLVGRPVLVWLSMDGGHVGGWVCC
jgi:hypothetical protein